MFGIGIAFALILVICSLLVFCRWRRKRKAKRDLESGETHPMTSDSTQSDSTDSENHKDAKEGTKKQRIFPKRKKPLPKRIAKKAAQSDNARHLAKEALKKPTIRSAAKKVIRTDVVQAVAKGKLILDLLVC